MTLLQDAPVAQRAEFAIRLGNFEGPLDLLLSLISKHELELTALALHRVTDDFISHIRAQGDDWDLGEATDFLLIAATLLDLKASRLLPGEPVDDEEDIAILEARDLLFARLLQYRAYKQVAAQFEEILHSPQLRLARTAVPDQGLEKLLPEVVLAVSLREFSMLAVRALTPVAPPEVSITHLHSAAVSVREQASQIIRLLRRTPAITFRQLIADSPDRVHVIARFLAVLELFRERAITFEQAVPLGELHIRLLDSDAAVEEQRFDEFEGSDSGRDDNRRGAK